MLKVELGNLLANRTALSGSNILSYSPDKIRVLYISRGEITETQSHLRVAFGREYITKEEFDYLNNEYQGLIVGVNKYINSINLKSKEEI